MATNICVGVGLKDIIKNNTYKWNRKYFIILEAAIGHGTFLLAKNSYIFSHNDKN